MAGTKSTALAKRGGSACACTPKRCAAYETKQISEKAAQAERALAKRAAQEERSLAKFAAKWGGGTTRKHKGRGPTGQFRGAGRKMRKAGRWKFAPKNAGRWRTSGPRFKLPVGFAASQGPKARKKSLKLTPETKFVETITPRAEGSYTTHMGSKPGAWGSQWSGDRDKRKKRKKQKPHQYRSAAYGKWVRGSYRDQGGYRDQPVARSWEEARRKPNVPAPRHSQAAARGWYLAKQKSVKSDRVARPNAPTYHGKRPPRSTWGTSSGGKAPKRLMAAPSSSGSHMPGVKWETHHYQGDASRSWDGHRAGHRKAAKKGWWKGHKLADGRVVRHRPRKRKRSRDESYHLRDRDHSGYATARNWDGDSAGHRKAAKKGWWRGHKFAGNGIVRHRPR